MRGRPLSHQALQVQAVTRSRDSVRQHGADREPRLAMRPHTAQTVHSLKPIKRAPSSIEDIATNVQGRSDNNTTRALHLFELDSPIISDKTRSTMRLDPLAELPILSLMLSSSSSCTCPLCGASYQPTSQKPTVCGALTPESLLDARPLLSRRQDRARAYREPKRALHVPSQPRSHPLQ